MNLKFKSRPDCQEYFNEQMTQFGREVEDSVSKRVGLHFRKHSVLDESHLQGIIIEEMCRECARLSRGKS